VRWSRILAGVYLALLLLAVLWPQSLEPLAGGEGSLILSERWLADAVRNVVLFIPLGVALAFSGRSHRSGQSRRRPRLWAAVAVGFTLSLGIEVAQLGIPGRTASPLDLLSNTLGAGAGFLLAGLRSSLGDTDPRRARRLSLSAAAVSGVALIATSWLLASSFPASAYYGGWTPELPGFADYSASGGRVLEARVGGTEIVSSGPDPNSAALRRALVAGEPIVVRALAGPAPAILAPLVTIADDLPRQILFLGIEGQDLVYGHRSRAAAWRLHDPWIVVPHALRGVAPGETFSLRIERSPRASQLRVGEDAIHSLEMRAARAWALFIPARALPPVVRPWLDGAWLLLLLTPASAWARRDPFAWAGVLALCALLWGLPDFGPMGALAPGHRVVMVLAVVAPALLGDTWARRRRGTAAAVPSIQSGRA
jgi:hypothetical protein